MTTVSGVGATPEPQNDGIQNANEQKEKHYSIFDNAPQDGVVSRKEQTMALLSRISDLCRDLKMNMTYWIMQLVNQIGAGFQAINTDGTKESAEMADEQVNAQMEPLVHTIQTTIQRGIIQGNQGEQPDYGKL